MFRCLLKFTNGSIAGRHGDSRAPVCMPCRAFLQALSTWPHPRSAPPALWKSGEYTFSVGFFTGGTLKLQFSETPVRTSREFYIWLNFFLSCSKHKNICRNEKKKIIKIQNPVVQRGATSEPTTTAQLETYHNVPRPYTAEVGQEPLVEPAKTFVLGNLSRINFTDDNTANALV